MEQNEKNEFNKLAHEITRLITRVDYHEKEMIESKRISDNRFAKLEDKLDQLSESIQNIKGDVKEAIIKIGIIAVAGMLLLQIVGKHFGIL